MNGTIAFRGRFFWLVCDRGGLVRDARQFCNGVTTEGLTDILDGYFRAGGVITPYLGLIDSSGYTAVAAADTLAAHAGWSEITAYSQATRPAWGPEAASGGVLANGVGALFTFTADKTVKGAFVASNDTKGGTTGVLWSTGVADAVQSLAAGESLRVYYDLTAASP